MKNNLSFIKVDINILNNTKFKLIRRLENGDSFFTLWIGIICLAMKSSVPGRLEISEGVAFTPSELATEFSMNEDIVNRAIKIFLQYKMLVKEKGYLFVKNIEQYQSIDLIELYRQKQRERQRRYRDRLKKLNENHEEIAKDNSKSVDDIAEEETNKNKSAKKIPPTAVQVLARMLEMFRYNNLNIEDADVQAEKFFDYYSSNGWRVGKNKMKDWHSAINNWIKNYREFNERTTTKSITRRNVRNFGGKTV